MYPVNQAFLEAIVQSNRTKTVVEYSNDAGLSWTEVTLVSGSITADRTSQTRWACSLVLGMETSLELDGVTPFGTRVRVRTGVQPLRGSPLLVPVGVYRVNDTGRNTDHDVTVEGVSLEAQVQDTRFLTPRTLGGGAGDSARELVQLLVGEAVPNVAFDWRVDGDQPIPRLHQDQDRWAVIDGSNDDTSIAKTLGAEVYCDASGTFVIAPTPTLYDVPVWVVRRDQALVKADESWERAGVYNVVVANGESTASDLPPVGPGIAWDNDPDSPTYAGPDPVNFPELAGPFGVVPRFYSSPLLTSLSGCQVAAQSLLADALGLHKTVSFDSVVNPAIEPGDVLLVEVNAGRFESHLIDSISYSLGEATMSCATRATTTRLLGLDSVLANEVTGDVQVSEVTE